MTDRRHIWQTWSRTVRCRPDRWVTPRVEGQLTEAVRTAAEQGLGVRVAGSGHSFNQLACTEDMLLDLSGYTGVLDIDRRAATVTVRGGTRLAEINAALDRAGLALANIGTLDTQTVAGAISTGNHGTGITHRPFSDQVSALRLVTAEGTVLCLEEESELMRAARTSLGTLGVISTVTLRCVTLFNLRSVPGAEQLDDILDRFEEWAHSADHVSFNWLPWTEEVFTRAWHRTDEVPTRSAVRQRYATTVDEMRCGLAGLAGQRRPTAVPWAKRFLASGVPAEYVDVGHRVFSFPQPVRFLALEHALPLENVPAALRELRVALRRFGAYSPYSVLVRVGAADDSPLSPAYGRLTGYVNLTVPRTARYTEILRTAEHLLRDLDGRPHWGKAHTATAEVLRPRYPEWDQFQTIRGKLDPTGMFSNEYIGRVLGPVDAAQQVYA
ncbi:D-arabinono-1,4-lactone oxidase [Spirillospora sp. NPDC049024]